MPLRRRSLLSHNNPETHGRWRQAYCRSRDLPRLVALWPEEIMDESASGRLKLIAKLRRALREERRRGLAAHWAYDLARHAGLLHAYRNELAATRTDQTTSRLTNLKPECSQAHPAPVRRPIE